MEGWDEKRRSVKGEWNVSEIFGAKVSLRMCFSYAEEASPSQFGKFEDI